MSHQGIVIHFCEIFVLTYLCHIFKGISLTKSFDKINGTLNQYPLESNCKKTAVLQGLFSVLKQSS